MKEVWKDIPEYNGDYQVSNLGRVRSLKTKSGAILKCGPNATGYPAVSLLLRGVQSTYYVHRLVAKAFIKNPENKPQVNHKDSNKTNNKASNLEWSTASENVSHFYKSPHSPRRLAKVSGRKNYGYCGDIEVFKNGKKIMTLEGKKDMAKKGFTPPSVYNCINGKLQTHKGCTFKRVSK